MFDSDRPPNDDTRSDEDSVAKRDRSSILARRKFFIASALAGIAAAGCNKEPQACLKVQAPPEPSAAPDTPPTAESPPPAEPTTAAPPPSAPVATADPPPPPVPTKPPTVCLKVPAPSPTADKPEPKVCLRVAAPPKDD